MPDRNRANYHIVRYVDDAGHWRWTMTDRRNNEVVGASHESFAEARDCDHNLFINTGWTTDEVKS